MHGHGHRAVGDELPGVCFALLQLVLRLLQGLIGTRQCVHRLLQRFARPPCVCRLFHCDAGPVFYHLFQPGMTLVKQPV